VATTSRACCSMFSGIGCIYNPLTNLSRAVRVVQGLGQGSVEVA
jgi:hypothetical protein